MDSFGYTHDENDDPLISDCNSLSFVTYYSTSDSYNAFDALYNNKFGLRDNFMAFWDRVSARFSKNPYVVGFDPINEPAIGNYWRDPSLLLPGNMDLYELQPLYADVFKKYKANADDTVMWFEPNTWPNVMGMPFGGGYVPGIIQPAGFEGPPGGEFGSVNHVLNDHTYCCQLNDAVCKTGEPNVALKSQCLDWHRKRIGLRSADAERYGLPLMITEFGACLTEASCTQEISQVADVSDEYLVGWAYWQFKYYGDLTTTASVGAEGFYEHDGTLQAWKVKALSRTYMMATQGVPTSQNFSMETSDFAAEFIVNTAIDAPTVVYVNQPYYYEAGYDYKLSCEEEQVVVDTSDSRYIKFQVKDAALNGQKVTIEVIKKTI